MVAVVTSIEWTKNAFTMLGVAAVLLLSPSFLNFKASHNYSEVMYPASLQSAILKNSTIFLSVLGNKVSSVPRSMSALFDTNSAYINKNSLKYIFSRLYPEV